MRGRAQGREVRVEKKLFLKAAAGKVKTKNRVSRRRAREKPNSRRPPWNASERSGRFRDGSFSCGVFAGTWRHAVRQCHASRGELRKSRNNPLSPHPLQDSPCVAGFAPSRIAWERITAVDAINATRPGLRRGGGARSTRKPCGITCGNRRDRPARTGGCRRRTWPAAG